MPPISPDSVPGTVQLPIWTLVAAIVVLFGVRELERRKWFEKIDAATKSIDALTTSVEGVIRTFETMIKSGAKP